MVQSGHAMLAFTTLAAFVAVAQYGVVGVSYFSFPLLVWLAMRNPGKRKPETSNNARSDVSSGVVLAPRSVERIRSAPSRAGIVGDKRG